MIRKYTNYISILVLLVILCATGCGTDEPVKTSGIATTVYYETTSASDETTVLTTNIPTGSGNVSDTTTSKNTNNDTTTVIDITTAATDITTTVLDITTATTPVFVETTTLPTTTAQKKHRSLKVLVPEASGRLVQSMNGYNIDYSNTNKGYIMVQNTTGKTTYIWIVKDGVTYQYKMQSSAYEAYPLSKGNGDYTVRVLQLGENGKGYDMNTLSCSVNMDNANNPYLYANSYVSFNNNSLSTAKSYELCFEDYSDYEVVNSIYNFVAGNISYDYNKANQITEGSIKSYVPYPDTTLSTGKGICSDYASLMASMIRAQGIPCKMVYGYINGGATYHAWNQVYYDGSWHLYDACIKSTGGSASSYIADKEY